MTLRHSNTNKGLNVEQNIATATKIANENETQWYSLCGIDYGTGFEFDADSEYGVCPDGSIVDCENCPLTDGDYETIAVKNTIG